MSENPNNVYPLQGCSSLYTDKQHKIDVFLLFSGLRAQPDVATYFFQKSANTAQNQRQRIKIASSKIRTNNKTDRVLMCRCVFTATNINKAEKLLAGKNSPDFNSVVNVYLILRIIPLM